MKAARLRSHRQPLVVEEVELAGAGPSEVLVEIAYAGFNPVDAYMAEGRVAASGPLPRTLGSEGAGLAGGRPVAVRGYGLGATRDGVWAAAAVVPRAALVPVPAGVSLAAAAAMGVAGVTAWRCATERAAVRPGDRVLVLGASGGVGSMLVSLCRSLGAEVRGHTGSAAKAGWVEARGAASVVVGGPGEVVSATSGWRPSVVFDPLGGGYFGAAIEALADKGRLISFGTSAGTSGQVPLQVLYRKGLTVNGYGGLIEAEEDVARGVAAALDAVAAGRMEVAIGLEVPLDSIAEAFAARERRDVAGKIVIVTR